MEADKRKRLILVEQGSREDDMLQITQSMTDLAKKGNIEAWNALREIETDCRFERLIDNSDDDEYEFA